MPGSRLPDIGLNEVARFVDRHHADNLTGRVASGTRKLGGLCTNFPYRQTLCMVRRDFGEGTGLLRGGLAEGEERLLKKSPEEVAQKLGARGLKPSPSSLGSPGGSFKAEGDAVGRLGGPGGGFCTHSTPIPIHTPLSKCTIEQNPFNAPDLAFSPVCASSAGGRFCIHSTRVSMQTPLS